MDWSVLNVCFTIQKFVVFYIICKQYINCRVQKGLNTTAAKSVCANYIYITYNCVGALSN